MERDKDTQNYINIARQSNIAGTNNAMYQV